MSKWIGIVAKSGLPISAVAYLGGGLIDGGISKNWKIEVTDKLESTKEEGNKENISFFKGEKDGTTAEGGLYIKKTLRSKSFGGTGAILRGGLGIKVSKEWSQGKSYDEKTPWLLLGEADNGMFYLVGWRVTIKKEKLQDEPKQGYQSFKSWEYWFHKNEFKKNEDEVGPETWCDEAFERYKDYLRVNLKVVIDNNKPIFLGNANHSNKPQIIVEKNGRSLINFGKNKCDYKQGFAFIAPNSFIISSSSTNEEQINNFDSYNIIGVKEWSNKQGVNLGNLKSLLLDRIDRISISEDGISDSRGNFVPWNEKYNPNINIKRS